MSDLTNEELGTLHQIAAFIAARLQYPSPAINGQGNPWVSTIRVDQFKEKFFYVRIYCQLADPALVKKKWEWIKTVRGASTIPARYLPDIDTSPDEPTKEFKQLCFRQDVRHYRRCYLDMVDILPPKFRRRICEQADYAELLHDDVDQLNVALDKEAQPNPEHPNYDGLAYFRVKYGVATNDELKAKLAALYARPSLREWNGDA